MNKGDHEAGVDHTDHAQPYRHEITISVGGDEDVINVKSPEMTGTPSPQSSQGADEISASSTDDDNAILTPGRKGNGDAKAATGLDNPAFESDNRSSQQRPMSSFGPNGSAHANGKDQAKGNGFDKPLAGKRATSAFYGTSTTN